MGIYDGAGIHGTDARGVDRHERVARLHPHAHRGRHRPLRPRAGRRAGLHRLTAGDRSRISSTGTSSQPVREQGGVVVGVSKDERADEHARSPCAQHRVPHGRGVVRAPGSAARAAAGASMPFAMPRLDELTLRGDAPGRRVDEEHGHRPDEGSATPAGATPCACSTPTCAAAAPPRRPRRAYAVDLGQLARGPRSRACAPEAVDARACAATPRASGDVAGRRPSAPSPASSPRMRAFFRVLREHGRIAQNPADLMPAPKRAVQAAARRSSPTEVAALLDRIPADDAARAARPRAVRARVRVRAARRGARPPRRGVDRLRRRGGAGRGQGRQDALRPGGGGGARAPSRATWSARARRSRRATASPRCSCRNRGGGCRRPTSAAGCAPGSGTPRWPGGHLAARPASQLRDSSSGGRCRPTGHPGAAWDTHQCRTTQIYTRVDSARLKSAYARSHPRA